MDAGFTTSFYKMLDIMYDHGNNDTKELSISMKRQLGISVVEQPAVVPVPAPQSPPPDIASNSSSSSSNTTGNGASKCVCVCVCAHVCVCVCACVMHMHAFISMSECHDCKESAQ